MPRVILLFGPHVGREFPVAGETLLGRGADCGIQVEDPSVSRHHARIERRGGRFFLTDMGSTNGTFRNGQRVAEVELQEGDEVVLGKALLRFAADAAAGPEEIVLGSGEEGGLSPPAPPAPNAPQLPKPSPRPIAPAPRIAAKRGSLLGQDLFQFGGFYRFLFLLAVAGFCVGAFFLTRWLAGSFSTAS